ncbi:hypothetical protein N5C46_22575 [Rossellomorea vietnamensis]|uniref:Uncharacterized protein n=1 Tax=Rossellomorea vietnamensis TaxID=218284 RepID=A0ACD4C6S6_9BACI|nr:hypothetical protein [Rossellomorea vietnamensis]UXH44369.1 hypothetical protein N5C46_22575 [Rossellomorea vietnamensis]
MTRIKNAKKETIIHEILLWKQTKMLPEQYCDYLLALYTEGAGIDERESAEPPKKHFLKDFLISISSILISLFVIYFTELSIVLQTTILASFVGLLMGVGIYYTKKQFSPLLLFASAACILLISTMELTERIFEGHYLPLYVTLFLNCFTWIGAGVKWKMNYFTLAGSVGAVLVGIYISL